VFSALAIIDKLAQKAKRGCWSTKKIRQNINIEILYDWFSFGAERDKYNSASIDNWRKLKYLPEKEVEIELFRRERKISLNLDDEEYGGKSLNRAISMGMIDAARQRELAQNYKFNKDGKKNKNKSFANLRKKKAYKVKITKSQNQ